MLRSDKQLADKCWELTQFTTADQIAIKIQIKNKEVVLCSAYMEGGKATVPPNEITKIVEYTKKHKIPLIMGTDTNSHHYLWGDKKSDKRGENLLAYLDSQELGGPTKDLNPHS